MNNLFKNMLPYEVILTIMGIVIFLVLLFLLVWSVMRKRPVAVLLPFFLIPVIMVAYSTLNSIRIGDLILTIKNLTAVVESSPLDTSSSNNLSAMVSQLKTNGRVKQNSDALLAIANAQIALGKYDSASVYLNKAEKITPVSAAIHASKKTLDNKIKLREDFSQRVRVLNSQIGHLRQTSDDTQAVHQIENILSTLQVPSYVHAEEVLTLAKSYAITGNKQQSLEIINQLDSTAQHGENNIDLLKDSIIDNTYQKQFFKHTAPPHAAFPLNQTSKKILKQTVIH